MKRFLNEKPVKQLANYMGIGIYQNDNNDWENNDLELFISFHNQPVFKMELIKSYDIDDYDNKSVDIFFKVSLVWKKMKFTTKRPKGFCDFKGSWTYQNYHKRERL